MPNFNQVQAVGMPWYKREDWDTLLEIFEDAHLLPSSYDRWRKKAEKNIKKLKFSGHKVYKANVDPTHFPAWCKSEGLNVNADGRMAWGSYIAKREMAKNTNR